MEQPGTYFYHVHYGMQRSEGLYGSLIVHIADGKKEPFRYDDELNLLLSDWWHKSSHEQEVGISSNPYRPNLSVYQLANASSKEMNNAHPRSWNKTYRLRIASTTALASLHLAIEDHNVTEVEGDGNYVQPNQTLSKVKDLPKCEPPKTPQLNDYDRSKAFTKSIFALQGKDHKPEPKTYHCRIILLNTQDKINGFIKWSINNPFLTWASLNMVSAIPLTRKAHKTTMIKVLITL
ncbi:hypothetical protein GOBAR_AA13498 [Gossypium barbadense]|uniref:Plastocyanin-like domain-containing protein n=1 Tax=Gossypium barbadense TaxID=3634 RepID=A0A2P5XUY3_GOSBA|nr:hypothetical protein GOBAR_AA13498 [Gossypium barbadense]